MAKWPYPVDACSLCHEKDKYCRSTDPRCQNHPSNNNNKKDTTNEMRKL